jgi:hypothetical protein
MQTNSGWQAIFAPVRRRSISIQFTSLERMFFCFRSKASRSGPRGLVAGAQEFDEGDEPTAGGTSRISMELTVMGSDSVITRVSGTLIPPAGDDPSRAEGTENAALSGSLLIDTSGRKHQIGVESSDPDLLTGDEVRVSTTGEGAAGARP